MAFQIRVTANCWLVNRSTGSIPGKLFQISTRRVAGHFSANAASSCRLAKISVSPPLSSICSLEPKAVMLFSLSILNLVIGSSPFGGKSSMTFALVSGRSKSFLERRTVRSVSAEPHRHGRSGLDLWLLHQPMIPRSRIGGRGDRAGLLLQESDVKLDVYEHLAQINAGFDQSKMPRSRIDGNT